MKQQKRKLSLYPLDRDGKGVSKSDVVTTTGLKGFFYRYRTAFGKLLYVNMFYVIGNVLLIFLILTFAGYTKLPFFQPTDDSFSAFQGVSLAGGEYSSVDLIRTTIAEQRSSSLANTPLTYVFWALSACTLLTFGCVNAGCTYLLRNLTIGEPVFVWSDFWHAVRQNWKQALPFGIFDGLILLLIPYNIYSMIAVGGNYLTSLMLWMNIAIFFIYLFMRFYIYVQMVTFRMKVFKIIKNALIFSLLGIKRNFVALIGILLLCAIEVLLLSAGVAFLLPFAIAFPMLLLFAHASFMSTYASYYVIKKYMIDPEKQTAASAPADAPSDPIDDGE